MHTPNKQIQLSDTTVGIILNSRVFGEQVALVDKKDAERTALHRWRVAKKNNGDIYEAVCEVFQMRLHRFLTDMIGKTAQFVIPKNGNYLDCRQENLMICSQSASQVISRCAYANNKSGYRGVVKHKKSRGYMAVLYRNKERVLNKYCRTKEEARDAYIAAVKEFYGVTI